MHSIRPSSTARRGRGTPRRASRVLAAVALASALALTASACDGDGDDNAGGSPSSTARGSDGKVRVPQDLQDKLRQHGIDMDKWKDGAWKNWDRDDWLREANDFINPIINGLWDKDRMRGADDPAKRVDDNDLSGDQGVTDPEPQPVQAKAVRPPYHTNAATSGKVFFDSPRARWSARPRWSRTRRTRASPT